MTFSLSPSRILRGAIDEDWDTVFVVGRNRSGQIKAFCNKDAATHIRDIDEFRDKLNQGHYSGSESEPQTDGRLVDNTVGVN